MFTALKVGAFILALGLDTLIISASLGMLEVRNKLKILFIFTCAEAFMPIIGFLIGKGTGQWVGNWASIMGGVVLVGISIWLLFLEDESEERTYNLMGWSLIMVACSISLDELAIGFSIGLIKLPVLLTISLIVIQAFLFSLVGLKFSSKIKPFLGEWTEKVAGLLLGLLGIWILIETIQNMGL